MGRQVGTYIYHDFACDKPFQGLEYTPKKKGVEELYHFISKVNEMKAKAKKHKRLKQKELYGNQEE